MTLRNACWSASDLHARPVLTTAPMASPKFGRYGLDDPQNALNWTFSSSAQGQYARVYGGSDASHRRVLLMLSTANASFVSPGACFAQNVSAADGAVVGANFTDECVVSPMRRVMIAPDELR